MEVYSVSSADVLDNDTSLITDKQTSPLVMSAIGEVIYPASVRAGKNSSVEPGLVVVDLPHQKWRKMVLSV